MACSPWRLTEQQNAMRKPRKRATIERLATNPRGTLNLLLLLPLLFV